MTNPDTESLINTLFAEHMEHTAQTAGELGEAISAAAETLTHSLLNDAKILMCANGIANSLAQFFCPNLLNRF